MYSLSNQETYIFKNPNQLSNGQAIKIMYNLCIVLKAKLEISGSHR